MTKIEKCRKEMKECCRLSSNVHNAIKEISDEIVRIWKEKFLPLQQKLYEEDKDLSQVFTPKEFQDDDIVLAKDCSIILIDRTGQRHLVNRMIEAYDDNKIVGIFGKILVTEPIADAFVQRVNALFERRLSSYLDEAGTMKREWQECLYEITKLQKGEQ